MIGRGLSRRARVSAGTAAAVAVALLLTAYLVTREGEPSRSQLGTSLVGFDPHGDTMRLPGGGVVTDGMEILQLTPGAAPVRITAVRLLEPHDMRLVGARVAGPERRLYQFTAVRGFPSRLGRDSRPAIGAVITGAPRGWELLVGVRAGSQGYPVFHGIEITYTSQAGSYRQVLQGVLIVCPRASSTSAECAPPSSLRSPAPLD